MKSLLQGLPVVTQIATVVLVLRNAGKTFHRDRPFHGLVYNVSGIKRYVFSDGTEVTVRAEEMLYLPKDSTYRVVLLEPGDCYAANFGLAEDCTDKSFAFHPRNAGAYAALFREAETVWRIKRAGYLLKSMELLYRLFYLLQADCHAPYISTEQFERIEGAVRYLHEHYTDRDIRVELLAEMSSMSSVTFRKLFERKYRISPLQYIRELRLARAKELLESQMYTVAEVAQLSGYGDECYFCREFKRMTGMTPSESRRQKML